MRRSALGRDYCFFIGLLAGLLLSVYAPQNLWEMVQREECPQEAAATLLLQKFGEDFEPRLNLVNKPLTAKKPVKNMIRPRYYSSELGIREKLFIGVMTSQQNINGPATAINRTMAHLVNKIKYFINADNIKINYKLKNIVGFTDVRENLRPFHVIKYIADNYLSDYDFFLIIPDTVYVDVRQLTKTILEHISVAFDVYMGITNANNDDMNIAEYNHQNRAAGGGVGVGVGNGDNGGNDMDEDNIASWAPGERNYCDLNAGILLSSSVVQKMRNNLDWCVRNGVTNVHSINIGRCIKYSSNLGRCQEKFQGIQQTSFALLPSVRLFTDLHILAKEDSFRNATTVHPVRTPDDFYRLHAFFSRRHLELLQQQSAILEHKSFAIANGTISNKILEIRWPLGVPTESVPETRYDILTWQLMNRTHAYLPNSMAEVVVSPLSRIDALDLQRILDVTQQYAMQRHPNLEFIDVHSIYRRFDGTRGLDYQIHLKFRSKERFAALSRRHQQHIAGIDAFLEIKSFQVVKPLGRVEVVPSPYVTESTRIAILVPTFEEHTADAIHFIDNYEQVFLYRYGTASKGDADPFMPIKTLALSLSTKYKVDGSRVAWVSIRLPAALSDPRSEGDTMLNSVYGRHELLSLAVADLSLPKLGLDSLVLMASTGASFKPDFLNRVRMNTIQGFQVFAPIGFQRYPCKMVNFCRECDNCDVSQASGYFDKYNNDVMSFYSRDYVQARKNTDAMLPIVHNDNDIEQLFGIVSDVDASPPSPSSPSSSSTPGRRRRHDGPHSFKIKTILEMFVQSKTQVHILRGVEPNLRFTSPIQWNMELIDNPQQQFVVPQCSYLKKNSQLSKNFEEEVPQRYKQGDNEDDDDDNEANHIPEKCVHLASRKQIGDAIIRFEDRSILQK